MVLECGLVKNREPGLSCTYFSKGVCLLMETDRLTLFRRIFRTSIV